MPRNNPKKKFVDSVDKITAKAKKDILSFDSMIFNGQNQQILYRMYLLNFYANIEGCVKNISLEYIVYLCSMYKIGKLIPHFHYIIKHRQNTTVIKRIKRLLVKKQEKQNSGILIDTLDNLNYETLEQILFILNVHENNYSRFQPALDNLVSKRNDIAHGNIKTYNKFNITKEEIIGYKKLALDIITNISNDLMNTIDDVAI